MGFNLGAIFNFNKDLTQPEMIKINKEPSSLHKKCSKYSKKLLKCNECRRLNEDRFKAMLSEIAEKELQLNELEDQMNDNNGWSETSDPVLAVKYKSCEQGYNKSLREIGKFRYKYTASCKKHLGVKDKLHRKYRELERLEEIFKEIKINN